METHDALRDVLGAVLVGGRSRRMGRDKALLEVHGVPMAQRVASALRGGGCARVVAVGPSQLSAGLPLVADGHPGEGPLGGILSALGDAGPDAVIVVACDLPWLDAATVAALLDAARAATAPIDVVMAVSGRREPLCALWMPSAFAPLQAAFDAGERAVHRAVRQLAVAEAPAAGTALINVNTPQDLPE